MIKGSCLCEGVQYEYHEEITEIAMCHCHMCKRAQGTPFVTNAPINFNALKFTQGESLLKDYFSSPGKRRVFCSQCGSPLFSQLTSMPHIARLRVGTVTEGKLPAPAYQIFCEEKSDWFVVDDSLPQYPKMKP